MGSASWGGPDPRSPWCLALGPERKQWYPGTIRRQWPTHPCASRAPAAGSGLIVPLELAPLQRRQLSATPLTAQARELWLWSLSLIPYTPQGHKKLKAQIHGFVNVLWAKASLLLWVPVFVFVLPPLHIPYFLDNSFTHLIHTHTQITLLKKIRN